MATVVTDIIDGRVTQTADGWEAERIALVTGVTGTASARMQSAVAASGMPAIGDEHPSITGIYVESLTASPESRADNQVFRVVIVYTEDANPAGTTDEIEVGATVEQISTKADINSEQLVVRFLPETDPNGQAVQYIAEAPLMVPRVTLRFSHIRDSSPGGDAKEYVGKVNNAGWTKDPNAPARTWLCTGIQGHSSDGGATYATSYDFAYNPDTWDVLVVYQDEQGNRKRYTEADGTDYPGFTQAQVKAAAEVRYQMYEQADFDGLPLT